MNRAIIMVGKYNRIEVYSLLTRKTYMQCSFGGGDKNHDVFIRSIAIEFSRRLAEEEQPLSIRVRNGYRLIEEEGRIGIERIGALDDPGLLGKLNLRGLPSVGGN